MNRTHLTIIIVRAQKHTHMTGIVDSTCLNASAQFSCCSRVRLSCLCCALPFQLCRQASSCSYSSHLGSCNSQLCSQRSKTLTRIAYIPMIEECIIDLVKNCMHDSNTSSHWWFARDTACQCMQWCHRARDTAYLCKQWCRHTRETAH